MTPTQSPPTDALSAILGIDGGSTIARLRQQKPNQIDELQAYYEAIFQPDAASVAALPLARRAAVAARVASHTGSRVVADWYAAIARREGVDAATLDRVRDATTPWTDDSPLGAAIRHADLLTTHPVDAQQSDLRALELAGYSPAAIVSLSQVIAFVSYQLRLVALLRALGAEA